MFSSKKAKPGLSSCAQEFPRRAGEGFAEAEQELLSIAAALNAPSIGLHRVRLSGIRTFLHPHRSDVTLFDLRERYVIARRLSESVAQAVETECAKALHADRVSMVCRSMGWGIVLTVGPVELDGLAQRLRRSGIDGFPLPTVEIDSSYYPASILSSGFGAQFCKLTDWDTDRSMVQPAVLDLNAWPIAGHAVGASRNDEPNFGSARLDEAAEYYPSDLCWVRADGNRSGRIVRSFEKGGLGELRTVLDWFSTFYGCRVPAVIRANNESATDDAHMAILMYNNPDDVVFVAARHVVAKINAQLTTEYATAGANLSLTFGMARLRAGETARSWAHRALNNLRELKRTDDSYRELRSGE